MLKYKDKYQVVQECLCQDGEWVFSENESDNYIQLKKGGQIYRYGADRLVLNLKYDSWIKTYQTDIKNPLKKIHKDIKKEIMLVDTYFFDDCVEIHFYEEDLDKLVGCLDKRFGTFSSKKKYSVKSIRWLPDYESKVKQYGKIKHTRLHKKLNEKTEEYFKNNGYTKLCGWKHIYSELRKRYGIDVSSEANDVGVKSINVIDHNNYYGKIFEVIEK
jgi:protein-tyrosine phosphatase